MRGRVLLYVSLVANGLLAAGWWWTWRQVRPAEAGSHSAATAVTAPTLTRTNILPRRQFFHWSEIESDDYATYVANLRAIGCPEQTIRDIIIADVNALYARRRATEVQTSQQQWWRAVPDPELEARAQARLEALEAERRELLTRLLGPQWETGDQISLPRPSRPGVALDGPILGLLPPETKQQVQEIYTHYQDQLAAYRERLAAEQRAPDPAELLRLQRQMEQELARVLAPAQLEEFLLRYSDTAEALRRELAELRWLELTPDQFRALFHARRRFEQGLADLAQADSPASALQRQQLEQQYEQALRLALGEELFRQYQRLQDPDYREAVAEARQAGQPELADTLYAIRRALAEEQVRLETNTALTALQKAIEWKRLELEALKARAEALGEPPLPEPAPPPPPMRAHTYRAGETLISLAVEYDVPLSAILRANPGLDFQRLKPGDTILIPVPSQ
ncbi:MAG: LysM peptidoglycan-binding domain-containing protein [Limisphaera sp.]|nr:LysM peptidoglycan-binding domain-containing protein [Limisphaera sp.]